MSTKSKTMNECCFANVSLPLLFNTQPEEEKEEEKDGWEQEEGKRKRKVFSVDEAPRIAGWLNRTAVEEHDTYLQLAFVKPAIWVRLSGQIYLELVDFEWVSWRLKELCERIERGEVAIA